MGEDTFEIFEEFMELWRCHPEEGWWQVEALVTRDRPRVLRLYVSFLGSDPWYRIDTMASYALHADMLKDAPHENSGMAYLCGYPSVLKNYSVSSFYPLLQRASCLWQLSVFDQLALIED